MSDGTEQVDKTRFDGLMGNYQKALGMLTPEQRASLKDQPESDDLGDLGSQTEEDSQYEEGGQYVFEGGAFVPFEPPTPLRHNETRGTRRETEDELPEPSRLRPQWTLIG